MLDFKNLQFLSCSPCRPATLLSHTKFRWNRTMVYDLWPKKRFSRWQPPLSWISEISIFGHVTVTGFNIWCSVPNFMKIARFFTEIWRFNDFQNGGRPPSWILHICIFVPWPLSACRYAYSLGSISDVVYQISSESDDFPLIRKNGGLDIRFYVRDPPKKHILGRNRVFWRILRQNPSRALGCSESKEPKKLTRFGEQSHACAETQPLSRFWRTFAQV